MASRWWKRLLWGEALADEVVVPAARRLILLRGAGLPAVQAAIADYQRVVGEGTEEVELSLAVSGDGVRVELAPRTHPYWLHNLGLWLSESAAATLVCVLPLAGSAVAAGTNYWLVPDPTAGDHLSGYEDEGARSLAVYVPENRVARGLALSHPPRPLREALAAAGLEPTVLEAGAVEHAQLRLERLGSSMNATLETTSQARRLPLEAW